MEGFQDEFGKTIVSVWVDEPHFSPPDLPWTRNSELFRQEWAAAFDNLPLPLKTQAAIGAFVIIIENRTETPEECLFYRGIRMVPCQ